MNIHRTMMLLAHHTHVEESLPAAAAGCFPSLHPPPKASPVTLSTIPSLHVD